MESRAPEDELTCSLQVRIQIQHHENPGNFGNCTQWRDLNLFG
jgi:hypothetical protein